MKFMFHPSSPAAFVEEARRYILHPRGWKKRGFDLRETQDARLADTIIYLRSRHEMDRKYGKFKHLRGLSVTDSRSHPVVIDIHQSNWESPPSSFDPARSKRGGAKKEDRKRRLKMYRAYLINHEVGHSLGFGHERLGKKDGEGNCMLMSQQSRSTKGCRPHGWTN